MKYLAAITILFLFLFMTAFAQPTKPILKSACDSYISERLESYFSRSSVKAAQIINNVDDEPNRSETETMKVGRHTVEWIIKNEGTKSSVSVRINGDLITIGDKKSLNVTDGGRRLDMNVVGGWRQVKLYKLQERDIIALTVGPEMCTGLMCSVGAQLYYDPGSKRSEFFGRYQTDDEAHLYRFSGDEGIFVIAASFDGDPHLGTRPAVVTYRLYRLLADGGFTVEKDSNGKEFWLRHTQSIEKEAKPDRLEQHWIEKLN